MKSRKQVLSAGVSLGLALALQSGCAQTAAVTQPTPKPDAVNQEATKPADNPQPSSLSGKVVETIGSGGYTYLNLEKDGKTTWVALPATNISVGQQVEVQPGGLVMEKFTSRSLNRVFDRIIFASGLVAGAAAPSATDGKSSLPAGHPPMAAKPQAGKAGAVSSAMDMSMGSHGSLMAKPNREKVSFSGKVLEAKDAGAYTYLHLEQDGVTVWAAVPTTKVTVGEELTLQPGTEMANFTSKNMNRTFESLIFSPGLMPAK